MRLASCTAGGGATFGVVVQSGVVDARRWLGGRFDTLRAVLEALDGLSALRPIAARPADHALTDITWLPAISHPGAIWCIGINYRAHSEQTGLAAQKNPVTFLRADRTLARAAATAPQSVRQVRL